jgi:hypothetical protein
VAFDDNDKPAIRELPWLESGLNVRNVWLQIRFKIE